MPRTRDAQGRFVSQGNGISWSGDLKPNLIKFPFKLDAAIGLYFQYEEGNVQNYMRNNAPWTDQTGNARQGLFAKAVSQPGKHTIVCYGTVPYQIWLEVANAGRFRIIEPTIQLEGQRVMQGISDLMSKL